MMYNMMNYPQDIMDRFWSKVNIKYNPDGTQNIKACMEWTGGKFDYGYGKFRVFKKHVRTHRFSYECYNGLIPEGLYVCHSCDNPPCVNPYHLWVGTHQENDQDKVKKGRSTIGVTNPMAKLSNDDVLEIVDLFPLYNDDYIADMFDVGHTIINRIRNGKNWSHITNIVDVGPKLIRLTEDQVREIKRRLQFESGPAIARDFGVAPKTINSIKNNKSWKHVIL